MCEMYEKYIIYYLVYHVYQIYKLDILTHLCVMYTSNIILSTSLILLLLFFMIIFNMKIIKIYRQVISVCGRYWLSLLSLILCKLTTFTHLPTTEASSSELKLHLSSTQHSSKVKVQTFFQFKFFIITHKLVNFFLKFRIKVTSTAL